MGETTRLLSPKQDVIFQALFGTKGSEKILGGLLSKILGKEVENVSLEANQNLVRENEKQKLGILDVRAKIGERTEVNIEIQMVDPENMFQRLLYYWSRMYGGQLKKKEDYSELNKTISILIANYDIKELEKFKDAHTIWKLLEKRDVNIELFEDMEIHIIEMPKVEKYKEETEEGLSTWIEFLSNPESELISMKKEKDENLRDAYEKLEVISGDEKLRRIAELKLKRILDENSMRNAATKRGLEQGEKIR